MKNFKHLLYSKLTLGLALSALGSLVFAILFRLYLDHFFSISPVRGGLTLIDLSYFLSIAGMKVFLSTLLELVLGDKFHISLGVYVNDTNSIISKMDKGKSSAVDKGSGSASGSGSGSNVVQGNSSEVNKYDVSDALKKEISSNLDTQYNMVKRLRELKNSRDLKYHNNNGALELDVPNSISDEEAVKLGQQVGVIDRIYNTKRSEYRSLAKQDESLRGSYLSTSKFVKDAYKDLFEK